MMSPKERKEYINAGGSFCLNCGSGNISADRIESEGRKAWRAVVCYDCGSEWNDIFKLIEVDGIRLPENDPMVSGVNGSRRTV